MIVWEDEHKHSLSAPCVAALKALNVGYTYIRGVHGALLGTFGFCHRADPNGYVITEEGRKALQVWEDGYDYDQAREDRKHRHAPGRKTRAAPDPG